MSLFPYFRSLGGLTMKKLQHIQEIINKRVLKFKTKQNKHICFAIKMMVFMFLAATISGFCYQRADYYVAFIYIVITAIFVYFIPFERLFLSP
jgi:hypothetical protein